jgi:hypothetical protein
MFALVVAEPETPDLGIGGTDVEDIQGAVEDYSPLDGEGDVNVSKYKPFVSKAEQRIDNINLWLKENAPWLSAVFGMVPELSLLFALNILIILWALVLFVFNGELLSKIFSVLENKIDVIFFDTRWANVFGFGIFLVLLATKFYVLVAEFAKVWVLIFWNYVLPAGLAIAIISIIILFVAGIAALIFFRQLLTAIGQAIKKRKEKKGAEKNKGNEEVLEKIIEGVTGE